MKGNNDNMKQVIEFLRQLEANNYREWFVEHKDEYQQAKQIFDTFAEQLISRVQSFDSSIQNLTLKDCTYRIYRDVRFSKDKNPYKTHMGCFICRGGKKSGYSGYYFHLSTGESQSYPFGHMIAVGDYCMEPRALQILREDIAYGNGDFPKIIDSVDGCYYLDESNKLKRPPKGFDDQTPSIELVKNKVFCLNSELSTEQVLAPHLLDFLEEKFRSAKPFIDYINRAIEFSKSNN